MSRDGHGHSSVDDATRAGGGLAVRLHVALTGAGLHREGADRQANRSAAHHPGGWDDHQSPLLPPAHHCALTAYRSHR